MDFPTEGIKREVKTPAMAMATKTSTRVKAARGEACHLIRGFETVGSDKKVIIGGDLIKVQETI